jgi:hypothetical protein
MQAFTPFAIALDVIVAPEIDSISLSEAGAAFTTVNYSVQDRFLAHRFFL